MCGRFASARKRQELLEEFGVQRDRVVEPLRPDYNVAPTKPVYAVVTRRPEDAAKEDGAGPDAASPRPKTDGRGRTQGGRGRDGRARGGRALEDGPGAEGAGVRELRVVRWGLVPFWAKDISIGSRLINARAETVASKPAFRHAFARHRCLLPADGFYEWEKSGDSKGAREQPHYIRREDGGVLAFAGL